ncbi:MAG: NAD(P)H-dependent oxidoreductase subunit E [Candidatus Heimdallarchaeum aukensis]|uniref:NAD(P)H-dependent oxidoreductase subunit E n=1 Tax=Candidatus Heimdallarchaeum aukensis TaxID=2876573 RepID=A0A9Y1BJT8_9ARCH|nr:MAG: NAD(P)H-dependent oxidoreductase subunit E [Candidatus Heimdallarchaeum aukensis]
MNADFNIDSILARYNFDSSALIQILSDAQDKYGYLPREVLEDISQKIEVPLSKMWGVISFYALFKLKPPAKYNITVCQGTACHVSGAKRNLDYIESKLNLKAGEHSPDGKYSLETVACIGSCALAPTIVINGKVYGRNTVKTIDKLLSGLEEGEKNE